MASYQARQRDPLLDQNMQAAIERRGKELLGVGLCVLGLMTALMLVSYSPDDPSWLASTDAPAQNILGRFGAAIASPLFVIAGKGAWMIAVIFAAWGARFLAHQGEDRALSRVIFAPIAVALASVYASTLVAGPEWVHSFGLGGLFGDTVLGALLGVLPFSAAIGLKALSFLIGIATLGVALFVLGFDMRELRAVGRFLLYGTIFAYDALLRLMGQGARASVRGAQVLQERNRARREAYDEVVDEDWHPSEPPVSAAPQPARRAQVMRAEPYFDDAAPVVAPQKKGLLARVSGLARRGAEPEPEAELIEQEMSWNARMAEAPSEERIRARIADAVRTRGQTAPMAEAPRVEPPLTAAVNRARAAMAAPAAPAAAAPVDGDVAPRFLRGSRPAQPEVIEAEPVEDYDDFDDVTDIDDSAALTAQPLFETEGDATPQRPLVQHAVKKSAPSRQAISEAQPRLRFDEKAAEYEIPPLNLLANPASIQRRPLSDEALEENARMLESVLDDYGVKGEITSVRPGPVVTMYELEPAPGLKASRVIGLADDIARSMSALSARVSTVPGRTVIGIELPNAYREKVVLREILSAREYGDSNLKLPLALGKDIAGEPVVANLAKMPHLLIAGTTGSGKSVAINTMILSLLYKLTPEECRLIMIDPKMLELSVYDGIPHLLSPVVTDPKKAVVALKWTVGEMEERYRKMSKMGVRNIEGYNGRVKEALAKGELFKRTVQTGFDEETGEPVFETEEFEPKSLPYIVVIVDEMADLMMVAGKEIEACIQRLAQMARASGIHLIMATQRPSVDVITGTIKANFPTRISFQVTSKIDSRTILGEMGAEQLLGMGDMLYMAGGSRITRIHGPFVSDEEVEEIVTHLKSFGPPEYMSGVVEGPDEEKEADIDMVLGLGGNTDGEDALYDQAVQVVLRDRKVSTSYIQRKLGIGYNKAARLVEQMEEEGLVSAANHVGKREILVPEQ
ncbi:S-DNA-T family DNA segregation ATPase FtsK/SpoIIIE [Defluviimonas denitrificans]|jgi:S-DNA-T family DNA segregation ATPase FtsK/SpoIIIE|uniref:DNA translocase FtsK n=1 Tax=Albidovulum denitrificans TaxID=404881 RepID=A0A2S8S487_9RHOB|nr:DNA translocase FtsK [Defluviimonas denitrificans]PQV55616.1 S-DNA-T family DNA segregation ATPase FtsK/SpoIIIE [Defluviimonas denitrificans]